MCHVIPGTQIKTIFQLQDLITQEVLAQDTQFDEEMLAEEIYNQCIGSPYNPTKSEVCDLLHATMLAFTRSGYLLNHTDNYTYSPYRRYSTLRTTSVT